MNFPDSKPKPSCPLCSHEQGRDLEVFPVADLCVAYLKQLQVNVASEFPDGLSELRLIQCNQCGLQFFYPLFAGSAAFYASLSTRTETYYADRRWEFTETLHLLPPNAAILDVGCGDGHFLSQLPHKDKMGIELNPQAAAKACARGLNVIQRPLADLASDSFDVVTLFHVAEHLAAPLDVLREAVRVLRAGGLLFISVPNNDAAIGSDLQHAANAPPHHPLRWRAEAFAFVPQLLQVQQVQVTVEPLNAHYAGLFRRVQLFKWIEKVRGQPLPLFRRTFAAFLAIKLANRFAWLMGPRLPQKTLPGFSLLAVFRKR
jgi:2-polyprenyl-3-methyl-5-hydroxy-6-metoxy-1,4-benzoquinol methylase